MSRVADTDTAARRRSVDLLLALYVSWREECLAVRLAYQGWIEQDGGQDGTAYAAYLAALDREEAAAHAYADQIDSVDRLYL